MQSLSGSELGIKIPTVLLVRSPRIADPAGFILLRYFLWRQWIFM